MVIAVTKFTFPKLFVTLSAASIVILLNLILNNGNVSNRTVAPSADAVIPLPEAAGINKTGRYVTICPSGLFDGRRLGNHLFNFAAMLHVAKLTGRHVAMIRKHPNGWLDDVFNINITRVDNIEQELCPCYTQESIPDMTYDISSLTTLSSTNMTAGKNILLCGFTQSWKYTVEIEVQLRRHLQLHASLSKTVDTYLQEVIPKHWSRNQSVVLERVGIHIRTGDYMEKSKSRDGFSIPTTTYFRQAMHYVVSRPSSSDRRIVQSIVISETIDWCQKWLNLSSLADKFRSSTVDIDLIYSIGKTAQFDFVLLTKSDVIIITSGSFGWWGAWLANKTTIYYRNFPTPKSRIRRTFKREDYYPSNWIAFGGAWLRI